MFSSLQSHMRRALLILTLLSCSAFAAGPVFPPGWRSPTAEEMQDSWRDKCQNRCAWIAADLDGNNLIEGAFLAVNDRRKSFGLLAFVYSASGEARWFILDEIKDPSWVTIMGVQVYSPGTYRVMCLESNKNCGPDGKKPLQIERPAISYFKSESASSIYYWHKGKKRFVRVWESD
jgi:hypothetical protein